MRKKIFFIVTLMLLFCVNLTSAQEFRTYNAILTPGKAPEGAVSVKDIQPLSSQTVVNVAKEVVDSWNNNSLENHLSNDFYDKTRLLDSLNTKVPKDASVRLLSVQGAQTLNQYEKVGESGKKQIISTISVNSQTQIEFNDAQRGFRRLEGTNQYIIRVTEEIE